MYLEIYMFNIWEESDAETLQDDDYHIFGLAVLCDHEWMVLRRIGNESGTRRLKPCTEIMTDRCRSSYRLES